VFGAMFGSRVRGITMNFFLTNTLCKEQGHYHNRYGAGATPPSGLPLDAGRSRPVSQVGPLTRTKKSTSSGQAWPGKETRND
jgi:hypothetical protein